MVWSEIVWLITVTTRKHDNELSNSKSTGDFTTGLPSIELVSQINGQINRQIFGMMDEWDV
jgi:hypothetical protein